MSGCTFFNVPKTFARRKPELWEALFAIAQESAPSIVLVDECDGVMSKQHTAAVPAINRLWKPVGKGKASSNHDDVLVLGATNKPEQLNGTISDRFGRPFEFTPLNDEARRAILKDNLTATVELSEQDWETLIAQTRGWNGRQLAHLCEVTMLQVEDEWNENGKRGSQRPITLSDFTANTPQYKDTREKSALSDEQVETAARELQFFYTSCKAYGPATNLRDVFKVLHPQTVLMLGATSVNDVCKNGAIPERVLINLDLCLRHAFPETYPTSGAEWRNIGEEKPSEGTELTNDALSVALLHKTRFSGSEEDVFRIEDLRMDHFIKSGTSYFQPTEGIHQTLRGTRVVELLHNPTGRELWWWSTKKKSQRFKRYITHMAPGEAAEARVSRWEWDQEHA